MDSNSEEKDYYAHNIFILLLWLSFKGVFSLKNVKFHLRLCTLSVFLCLWQIRNHGWKWVMAFNRCLCEFVWFEGLPFVGCLIFWVWRCVADPLQQKMTMNWTNTLLLVSYPALWHFSHDLLNFIDDDELTFATKKNLEPSFVYLFDKVFCSFFRKKIDSKLYKRSCCCGWKDKHWMTNRTSLWYHKMGTGIG